MWEGKPLYDELSNEERALADSLIALSNKVGPLDKAKGIWVGYESAATNENASIGVKCGNCALHKSSVACAILDMPIEEAMKFFESVPAIARFLTTLCDVGLGYVRLGQSAPTLSGGEAQRVKLATELQRRSTGRTIYVLDEPTTGLHFEDVRKLLLVLNRLVDTGNTVIVIEHNLDVIKCADWVIDLGPEGGSGGGLVVAEGRPEDIVKNQKSYTGKFLANALKK